MPQFPDYKLINLANLTDDDILLIADMVNPHKTYGLQIGVLKELFQGAGLTSVEIVNGQTGVVVLTGDNIPETVTRLWLTPEERIKISQSNTNFIGYFANPTELQTSNPSANAGDWAIVESTDTAWIWSIDLLSWVDTGSSSPTVTVIDNLTTQDPTSALSANQGYVLNQLISQFNVATMDFNVVSHGYTEGLPMHYEGGWSVATNGDVNLYAVGIISDIIDADNFTIAFQGVHRISGFQDFKDYYLGDSVMVDTRPQPGQWMQKLGVCLTGGYFLVSIDGIDRNWDEINSDTVIEGDTHLFLTEAEQNLIATIPGLGAGGASGSFTVNKPSHGFALGDPITKNSNTGIWELADRSVWETTAQGIVGDITDADNVICVALGNIALNHGYAANSGWAYLSTVGEHSQTRPSSGMAQELFYPTSSTTAFVYIQRPIDLDSGVEGSDLSGYMTKLVYDPSSVGADAFDMDNMTEGVDTKILTDAERVKLLGIEDGAQVNVDAATIKALYESNADTNEFDDAEQQKLADLTLGANQNLAEVVKFNSELDNVFVFAVYGAVNVDDLSFSFFLNHLDSVSARVRLVGGTWGVSRDVITEIVDLRADIDALPPVMSSITEMEFTATYDSSHTGLSYMFLIGLIIPPGGLNANLAYISLSDTPNSYSGQAGKQPQVNIGEDGIEFVTALGGGNLKSDGTIPMDGGYVPTIALQLATKSYVDNANNFTSLQPKTGNTITFDDYNEYNAITPLTTGNITIDPTGAVAGSYVNLYFNGATEPTISGATVQLTTGTFVANQLNIYNFFWNTNGQVILNIQN